MDTIGDMLTIIRNGYMTKKEIVIVSHSKLKEEVAKKLYKLGCVESVDLEKGDKKKSLKIKLKYEKGEPAIVHVRRVSTPGLRVYRPKSGIKPVLSGMGFSLVSTSKGIMTDRESLKAGVGGEIICEVW